MENRELFLFFFSGGLINENALIDGGPQLEILRNHIYLSTLNIDCTYKHYVEHAESNLVDCLVHPAVSMVRPIRRVSL